MSFFGCDTLFQRTSVAFRQYNKIKQAKYGLFFRSLNIDEMAWTYNSAIYAEKPVREPVQFYTCKTEEIIYALL